MNGITKSLQRLTGAATIVLLLAGCSPAAMVSMLTPTDDLLSVQDIAYGDHSRQRLDLYSPHRSDFKAAPVVVFFYGGAWVNGQRGDYLFAAEALVSRGYLVVIPDYRVYPEVRFPGFVNDGASATAWVLENVEIYGGDLRRVYLMGHSAGAHIAAMLTFDERFLRLVGHQPTELAGLIGLAGPYDFLPIESRTLQAIFGPPERYALSQPVNFVDGNEPPTYLLHGENDRAVLPRNTQRLAAKIAESNGQVKTQIYEDLGHYRLVGALARPFRDWAPVLHDIGEFIDADGDSL